MPVPEVEGDRPTNRLLRGSRTRGGQLRDFDGLLEEVVEGSDYLYGIPAVP